MNEPIISVSGLRGIVGQSLRPDVVVRYLAAFAYQLPPGPVVVTRDSRPTGAAIAELARGALAAAGRRVIDAGIAATPTTGVLVRSLQAAGGVQISASHNPAEYNGIKLFSAAGRVIDAAAGREVLEAYRRGVDPWQPAGGVETSEPCDDALSLHLERVLAQVDVERIRRHKFRVLLDANHGAGALLGAPLLMALGCEATMVGESPSGSFTHPPEPTAENLTGVCQQVLDAGAAVGFCQDPDADRLALIDEGGRYLGEEFTLALCVDHVLGAGNRRGPVVTNCSTSRMTSDLAAKYGVPYYRSAVGEANVVDAMLAHEAVFGGEGNGGPIDPRVGLVRDSFVGMALVLDGLAKRGEPLSAWAATMPQYAIHKSKATLAPSKLNDAFAALEQTFCTAERGNPAVDRLDGLRLDWPDAWLLVRGSNTEPIVRIIAEARDAGRAKELCARAELIFIDLSMADSGKYVC